MNPRTALIVAAIALVLGAVGLYVGIDAKNSSEDARDATDATQAELEQQLSGAESKVEGS